jgi:hypothetical protein
MPLTLFSCCQGHPEGSLGARMPLHYITKHLQQRIEDDHFRIKRATPRVLA